MKVVIKNSDLLVFQLAIWFYPSKKKSRKGKKLKKDKFVTFDVKIHKDNTNNNVTTEWSIRLYKQGTVEEYICWQIQFNKLANAYGLMNIWSINAMFSHFKYYASEIDGLKSKQIMTNDEWNQIQGVSKTKIYSTV